MIYILKFDRPLGDLSNPRGQAQYYLGYCEDGRLADRLAEHRAGSGAAITRACVKRGIPFDVLLTLPGDRAFERRLKTKYKNTPRLVRRLLAQKAAAHG